MSWCRSFRVHGVAVVMVLSGLCAGPTMEISRERAIEIARSQVSFEPDTVDAERAASTAGSVWRVTLRGRLPGQPPGLFETAIVDIDRRSGAVVSIART